MTGPPCLSVLHLNQRRASRPALIRQRKHAPRAETWSYTLAMELLERGHFLNTLDEYARDAGSGSGRFVLLAGEAGVGKTSLLEAFRDLRAGLRWWWGACDGSFTPRPLGPLYDIAVHVGGRLIDLCADEVDRRQLFAVFLAELNAADAATVVVIEDLHWADSATLDWLRHLSRRIAKTRALVIATYRDDEPAIDNPLPGVIGQIARHSAARRMSLPALSPEAVRRMAGDAADADELYRLTAGVPFYVAEVLNAAPGEVPRTVSEIVTARMSRLPPAARQLLAAAAAPPILDCCRRWPRSTHPYLTSASTQAR
jgi:predicted ATPase